MRHKGVVLHTVGHMAGPAHYSRHHCATLERTVLVAAERSSGAMVAHKFLGMVIVTVVKHRAIVARQNHKRVVGYPERVQSIEHPAHGPVKLGYRIAAQTHFIFAAETLMRETGHMHVVGTQIHEKRIVRVGILAYEVNSMVGYRVGYVLVLPQSLSAALHEAYAAYTVYNRHIVAVGVAQIGKQLRIVAPGGFAFKIGLVAHVNRSVGVIIGHRSIFYEHAWHSIGGGSHDVMIVEAYVGQAGGEGCIPVLLSRFFAEAQMPLAYGSRAVTRVPEHIGHSVLGGADNHSGITGSHFGVVATPGIFAGKE